MTDEGVCIVTQPERKGTGKSHVKDLADIIAEITSVVILTANLDASSPLRDAHDVEVYSEKGTGSSVVVEAIRFVLNQFRLCLAIRRRPEDIILFFGTTSYVLPVLVGRLLGKKIVILPRGDVPLSLRLRWQLSLPGKVAKSLATLVRGLERLNYQLSHAIITYTPSLADQLNLERFSGKLYTNGARYVDTDIFSIQTPIRNREKVVGYVGRFDVEKRMPLLVSVAKALPDDVKFLFVGDGQYRATMEDKLAEEIDSGSISIKGWVDREELPNIYNQLRLLVVSSHETEGLPTVMLEGMACGAPSLARPVAGIPDVIEDGETGYFLTETNPESIAVQIDSLLSSDDIESVSSAARADIEEQYSFEAAVERYRVMFNEILF